MSTFGEVIKINLFGESHGKAIGIVINNLPAGISFDFDNISEELLKRRPNSNLSTPRREEDHFEIISGYFDNHTTGTPLTILIPNNDTQSKDYRTEILRPSHADYTAYKKYNNFQDYRGGGHFSGRLTAPLVILGAISQQILAQKGIKVVSHIASIKEVSDVKFNDIQITNTILQSLKESHFPLIDDTVKPKMEQIILNAKAQLDSVGGIIETMVIGLKPGYGTPYFDSIESVLSHMLFSIPAVKGLDFGAGFDITKLYGSEANDLFFIENGSIKTKTNHSGGIQGGISNGMPIIFKTAIKPTASIGKPQNTVDIANMEEVTLTLEGRHDPCIVHRVIHVINAVTSYTLLDIIAKKEGLEWIK